MSDTMDSKIAHTTILRLLNARTARTTRKMRMKRTNRIVFVCWEESTPCSMKVDTERPTSPVSKKFHFQCGPLMKSCRSARIRRISSTVKNKEKDRSMYCQTWFRGLLSSSALSLSFAITPMVMMLSMISPENTPWKVTPWTNLQSSLFSAFPTIAGVTFFSPKQLLKIQSRREAKLSVASRLMPLIHVGLLLSRTLTSEPRDPLRPLRPRVAASSFQQFQGPMAAGSV
mmetsp:Transcript_82683/g.234242  ORF Transcript_82683/g.234242 Transcript_82683/m.234242 type:complete len:229 (-) Transcript_82683:231-917(-)